MKNITISIVTCTFNSEKYLEKALESIEIQTYHQIEHIINDAYSTDSTLEIIGEYIERNKDRYVIKFIQSEPKGVGDALNVATKEATGDIIHYLHSDDYYKDQFSLEKVAFFFNKRPDLVWLTGNFLIELAGRKIVLPQTLLLRKNPKTALSVMNFISHENTFMKRDFVQSYGAFNEAKNEVVEYSLWLNLIKDKKPLVVNDEFTVFVIHKGSTSTGSVLKFAKAVIRAFRTQRKEKVFPLIGYYADNRFYIFTKSILRKVAKFTAV
ncbi:MAG TPA: glycosyltransferase [Anaerolineaceae bacterium]|nr:glycosyltransferase [Anaerolineaceae bacterium]